MKRHGSPQAFAETLALLQEKRIRVHVLPTGEAGITPRCVSSLPEESRGQQVIVSNAKRAVRDAVSTNCPVSATLSRG
jgi:hypothetical protein